MNNTTEDYLKMIYLLQKKNSKVRSISLVEAFGVSKPTVSKKIKHMIAGGYISLEGHSLKLTEKGLEIAEEMMERNRIIKELLIRLGVEQSVAVADACKIEHAISKQTLEAFEKLSNNI